MDDVVIGRLWELRGIIITMGAFARSATSTCASTESVDEVTLMATDISDAVISYVTRLKEENEQLKREKMSLNTMVGKLQQECERLEKGEG